MGCIQGKRFRPLTVRSCERAGAAGPSRRGCAPGYFYLRNLDQEICSTRATVFKFLSFFRAFFFFFFKRLSAELMQAYSSSMTFYLSISTAVTVEFMQHFQVCSSDL